MKLKCNISFNYDFLNPEKLIDIITIDDEIPVWTLVKDKYPKPGFYIVQKDDNRTFLGLLSTRLSFLWEREGCSESISNNDKYQKL